MNHSRVHTQMAIFFLNHFHSDRRWLGRRAMRPSTRRSSLQVSTALLAATHAMTTAAESTRTSPDARGRVSREKLKKSWTAPPVNTHP